VAQTMIKVLLGITKNANPFEWDRSEPIAVSSDEDVLKEYAINHSKDFTEFNIVSVPYIKRKQ